MGAAYNNAKLTLDKYGNIEPLLSSFHITHTHFFNNDYIKDGYSILDIGGAAGVFAEAIKREVVDINATVIDPDKKCIEYGKKKYPHLNFIHGLFPEDLKSDSKFDVVSMQALFPQLPNWKDILLSMQKHANKYINFSCILKLDGTTVVDKDVSYVYGLDSGERLYQVVHNLNEIINFMSIYEMRVKKINFWGECSALCFNKHPYCDFFNNAKEHIVFNPFIFLIKAGHTFRGISSKFEIKGNFMLELFDEKDNPKRFGGGGEECNLEGYNFFEPEKNIKIVVLNEEVLYKSTPTF